VKVSKSDFDLVMRLYYLPLLAASLAYSQQQAPAPAPATPAPGPQQPGQTASQAASEAAASGLKIRGPENVAAVEPDRVVAVINGDKVTAKQAITLLKYVSPDQRKKAEAMPGGLPKLLENIYLSLDFAKAAEKKHLDEAPPFKDQLFLARTNILTQAYVQYLTTQDFKAEEADIQKTYNDHIADYDEMKLGAIFVSYTPAGGKPPANGKARTQEEAKAKAEDLVKKIRGGADFATLAKAESDDANSAAKGGDMGTITAGKNNLPEPIKSQTLKLKKGEVTDPIDERSGYWIIYMKDHEQKSYQDARPMVLEHMRQDHAAQVMQTTLKQYAIQIQDNDFFSTGKPEEKAATPSIPSLANPPKH